MTTSTVDATAGTASFCVKMPAVLPGIAWSEPMLTHQKRQTTSWYCFIYIFLPCGPPERLLQIPRSLGTAVWELLREIEDICVQMSACILAAIDDLCSVTCQLLL